LIKCAANKIIINLTGLGLDLIFAG